MTQLICKKCAKDIASNDIFCRNCGTPTTPLAKSPTIKPAKFSLVTWFFICLLLGFFALMFIFNSGESKKVEVDSKQVEAAKQAGCAEDLECTVKKVFATANAYCYQMLDAQAKSIAKWDYKIEEPGFATYILENYRWDDSTKKQIIFYGDKAKFQNGFGAWRRVPYECTFNLATDRPVSVYFNAGQ